MLTKSRAALAAVLFVGSTSLALAQGYDPNLANRYPHLANPYMHGYVAGANTPTQMDQGAKATYQSAPARLRNDRKATFQSAPVQLRQDRKATFQSAPVQLRQGGAAGVTTDRGNYSGWESEFDVDRSDRASSPYAGGG